MSLFRRMLLVSEKEVWKAKLTLYFDDDDTQYVSTYHESYYDYNSYPDAPSEDFGVGFILSGLSETSKISIVFRSKETGEVIPHFANDSWSVYWLSKSLNNLVAGYYEVELNIVPGTSSQISFNNISLIESPSYDSKSSPTYVNCFCLASIDLLKPDYNSAGKGLTINMS